MSDEQPPPEPDGEPEPGQPRRLDPLKAAREAAERAEGSATPPAAPAPAPRRIDPDRTPSAVGPAGRLGPKGRPIAPVIDTRKYQRRVAYIGIALVLLISLVLFVENGVNTPGVSVGQYLHRFVAPLATSGITLPANADPHCNPAKPKAGGLNMCNRRPIVLAFFITGDGNCVNQVDALQKIAPQFRGIEFAALAVQGNASDTARLVRTHHWTIPVGTDSDGRVGALYGVEFCPLVEIAQRGGLVKQRLIGDAWANPTRLAAQVRKYLGT
jgi:hypothetical protein